MTRSPRLPEGCSVASASASGPTVPTFLARTALAAPDAAQARGARTPSSSSSSSPAATTASTPSSRSRTTCTPKYRPTIKVPADQVKKINDSFGLHPSLDGLAGLLEDRSLCVVQGVGYPEPEPVALPLDGHLAGGQHRRDAHRGLGRQGAEGDERRRRSTSPATTSRPRWPRTARRLACRRSRRSRTSSCKLADKAGQKAVIEEAAKSGGKPGLLDFVQQTALNTYASSQKLQEIGKNYEPKVPYPRPAWPTG